jgi:polyisoprenoid-binding protein YceI
VACALLLACPALAATGARAADYVFEGGHTSVLMSWSHAGLSRHAARIVGASGTLSFEPADATAARLEVVLDANRLSTGVASLDRLLKGPDFFDVGNHPMITFRSTSIRVAGERIGEVTGELTIRGITRPAILAVRWNFAGEHPLGLINPSFAGKFVAGFSATAKVLRSEWGLGRGTPLVSDEVELQIEAELIRK